MFGVMPISTRMTMLKKGQVCSGATKWFLICLHKLWLWLELTLPETLTLTHNPNSQNEIVEGHN